MFPVALFIFVLILAFFPKVRIFVKFIPKNLVHVPRDIYIYFKHKKYNLAPIGFINGYVADSGEVFGSGKTLSAVKRLTDYYNHYNGLKVWSDDLHKFVTQYIFIFTNIDINCNGAVKLSCLKQYSDFVRQCHSSDDRIVSYLFVDEAGTQWNSRSFSGNFNADFISDIVTCRHNNSAFLWTSQDFSFVDKLLRTVTTFIIGCSHIGRIFYNTKYSARMAENITDLSMCKPIGICGLFATDKVYAKYDTRARFERMAKDIDDNNVLSADEIINRRIDVNPEYHYVKFNHRGKKFAKKLH